MKTLGSYLVDALQSAGVRHVFGIPGIHNLELYRGLQGSSIQHVVARHEQGLGFMADGYARVSGLAGVCFTISGPGVSNIITALGQAFGDSIPILVISSLNQRGEAGSGRGFLHELPDQRALAAAVSSASFTIDQPTQLPVALSRAFEIFSTERPRPVYIEIPLDLLRADIGALPAFRLEAGSTPRAADSAALAEAARRLRDAHRPLLLAGGGARRAAPEVRKLAERLSAPLVMTTNARGMLPPAHPLAVPMSPSLAPVRALIAASDLVLAIGTELGPTDFDMYGVSEFPAPAHLIRIDIDAAQMNRNAVPQVALLGDARDLVSQLLSQLESVQVRDISIGSAAAAIARRQALQTLTPVMRRHLALLDLIRDTLPTSILVGDSTQLIYAGDLAFAAATPGSWFNSATGYGTLGYALPASIGASIAAADRPVVCLVGDGGLQFSLAELAVLRETNAWTAVVVWNNHGYGEIRSAMLAAGIAPLGVDVMPPDMEHLARAYDLPYRRIKTAEALSQALREFGQRRQTMLLELPERDLMREA